jgi:two-component system LytT family response regulator
VLFLDAESIDWVQAEGNYARLHVGAETHVVRHTMADLLAELGEHRFARVHRSHIVNVARVRSCAWRPAASTTSC